MNQTSKTKTPLSFVVVLAVAIFIVAFGLYNLLWAPSVMTYKGEATYPIHQEPSVDSPILGELKKGNKVPVLAYRQKWMEIQWYGGKAYIPMPELEQKSLLH